MKFKPYHILIAGAIILLLGFATLQINTIFMPQVYSRAWSTPTSAPTWTPVPPTNTPSPTATPTPYWTPIPDYPNYNWVWLYSAGNISKGTKINGKFANYCDKLKVNKTGKTLRVWTERMDEDECRENSNNPNIQIPMPQCVDDIYQQCTCSWEDYTSYDDEWSQFFCGQAFFFTYSKNSKQVCSLTTGCIDTQ